MTIILDGTNGVSDVDGSASTPAIRGTDANTGVFFPAADTVAMATGGSERVRVDSSGNVGIGTSSPNVRTEVSGTEAAVSLRVNTANTGNSASNYSEIQLSDVSTVRAYWRNVRDGSGATIFSYNDHLRFQAGSTERVRITNGGDFLVAKTTTADTTVGAAMLSNGRVTSTLSASTSGDSTLHVYSTGAGAYRFYVNMAGTVLATSTTITAISDQRLKENIQDIDAGLDKIMALKPRKFDWKPGKGKDKKGDRGWIAQEFEQVFPEMIDTWKDPAPEGEEPYKAVNADLIPVLVKAIQEQQALIQQLTERVAALEAKGA